jgi:hypothetical protein
LGVRAAMLDKSLVQIASLVEQIQWVNVQLKFDAEHLAEDGYHPNGQACAEIAGYIATSLKIESLLQSEKKLRISAGG